VLRAFSCVRRLAPLARQPPYGLTCQNPVAAPWLQPSPDPNWLGCRSAAMAAPKALRRSDFVAAQSAALPGFCVFNRLQAKAVRAVCSPPLPPAGVGR